MANVRREPDRPDPATVDTALTRAREALAGIGVFESAALVRAERDARLAERA